MFHRTYNRLVVAALLVIFAVVMRLLPHPVNVVPMGAIAITGGMLLGRRSSFMLPVVGMILSDFIIGLHPLVLWTWGSLAASAVLAHMYFRDRAITPLKVVASSLLGSTLFFVVTNFGVWQEGGLYEHTAAGFVRCYVNAIPFFRNTLLGDLLYVSLLSGAYLMYVRLAAGRRAAVQAL